MTTPNTTVTEIPAAPVAAEPPAAPAPVHVQLQEPTLEVPPIDTDGEPVKIDALLGDPTEADVVAAATPPVAATLTPASPVVTPDEVEEELQIVTRADGKLQLGKYVADDAAGLALEIEKGRRNAEKLVGKKSIDPDANPFLQVDEFEPDEEPYTEQEIGATFGAGIVQAMIDAGLAAPQTAAPAEPDNSAQILAAQAQVIDLAQRAIDSDQSTSQDFQAALLGLVQYDPTNVQARQTVLEEWASRGPKEAIAAAQEGARIEIAFAQHQSDMAAEQRRAAEQEELTTATAEEQAELEHIAEVQQAYTTAQTAFEERNPDWGQYAEGMKNWMIANKPIADGAKGNPAAVFAVLTTALQIAKQASAAGLSPAASEQGGNMNLETASQYVAPTAEARAEIARQRDLAALEVGDNGDIAAIQLTNPNPAGLAETPTADLLGMPMVG